MFLILQLLCLFLLCFEFCQALCQLQDSFTIVETVDEALRNALDADLGANQCASEHGAHLVLTAAVDGRKHALFKVIGEASRKVVDSRQDVIDCARKAVDLGHLPRRLDLDVFVVRGADHVERREQSVGRRKADLRRIRVARLRRLQAFSRHGVKRQLAALHKIHEFARKLLIESFTSNDLLQ